MEVWKGHKKNYRTPFGPEYILFDKLFYYIIVLHVKCITKVSSIRFDDYLLRLHINLGRGIETKFERFIKYRDVVLLLIIQIRTKIGLSCDDMHFHPRGSKRTRKFLAIII